MDRKILKLITGITIATLLLCTGILGRPLEVQACLHPTSNQRPATSGYLTTNDQRLTTNLRPRAAGERNRRHEIDLLIDELIALPQQDDGQNKMRETLEVVADAMRRSILEADMQNYWGGESEMKNLFYHSHLAAWHKARVSLYEPANRNYYPGLYKILERIEKVVNIAKDSNNNAGLVVRRLGEELREIQEDSIFWILAQLVREVARTQKEVDYTPVITPLSRQMGRMFKFYKMTGRGKDGVSIEESDEILLALQAFSRTSSANAQVVVNSVAAYLKEVSKEANITRAAECVLAIDDDRYEVDYIAITDVFVSRTNGQFEAGTFDKIAEACRKIVSSSGENKRDFENCIEAFIGEGVSETVDIRKGRALVYQEANILLKEKMPTLMEILEHPCRIRRFLSVLSLLREMYPYNEITNPEDRERKPVASIEHAEASGAFILLGREGIHMALISEGFRRPILYVKDDKGEIFSIELKIPGRDEERDVIFRRHFVIAKEMWDRYGEDARVVRPLFFMPFKGGPFYMYGREFNYEDYPLGIMGFVYQDGKRLMNVFERIHPRHQGGWTTSYPDRPRLDEYLQRIAARHNLGLEEFIDRLIADAVITALRLHRLGYRGNSPYLHDMHSENVRIVIERGRAEFVGDFGAFRKVPNLSLDQRRSEIERLLESISDYRPRLKRALPQILNEFLTEASSRQEAIKMVTETAYVLNISLTVEQVESFVQNIKIRDVPKAKPGTVPELNPDLSLSDVLRPQAAKEKSTGGLFPRETAPRRELFQTLWTRPEDRTESQEGIASGITSRSNFSFAGSSEYYTSPEMSSEQARRYEGLESFINRYGFDYKGPVEDGSVHMATPYHCIYLILDEVRKVVGLLYGKRYLSFGAGGLNDSLVAWDERYDMSVVAVEKDPIASKKMQEIAKKAIELGFADKERLKLLLETDALDVSWKDIDVAFFFYTEPSGDPDEFRERIVERVREMKPQGVFAVLFTGMQLQFEYHIFPEFKTKWEYPTYISEEMEGLYLQLYRAPNPTPGVGSQKYVLSQVLRPQAASDRQLGDVSTGDTFPRIVLERET